MKKTALLLITVIITVLLSSCGNNSGNLIGKFQVIDKKKANTTGDYGYIALANSSEDTLQVFISMEEEYLNVKIGDTYLVGKNRYGSLYLNDKPIKGVVGYSIILQKKIIKGVPQCIVITRGQDTIVSYISEVMYYNVSVSDSVFVKKNRDEKKPHYFVE